MNVNVVQIIEPMLELIAASARSAGLPHELRRRIEAMSRDGGKCMELVPGTDATFDAVPSPELLAVLASVRAQAGG